MKPPKAEASDFAIDLSTGFDVRISRSESKDQERFAR
jgi:hypothetical protein